MPRPARTTNPVAPAPGDFLRQLLGLTQQQWALSLGTTAARVADAESGRRSLPLAVQDFDLWLALTSVPVRRAVLPVVPAPPLPVAEVLPLPLPVGLQRKPTERRLRVATRQAYNLRFALTRRQQQLHAQAVVQACRRACVAALAAPSAAAEQYRSALTPAQAAALTARAARLATYLADHIRIDDLPGGPLDPTAFAIDQLRLALLETEAATLTAWLAPPAPG